MSLAIRLVEFKFQYNKDNILCSRYFSHKIQTLNKQLKMSKIDSLIYNVKLKMFFL